MKLFGLTLACLLLLPVLSLCQEVQQDFTLLQNSVRVRESAPDQRKGLYQKVIQPQVGTACVFETSCRDFRKGLFREFGILKAASLTVDRWGRCTHLSTMESLPVRLNAQGKIVERPIDYRIRQ